MKKTILGIPFDDVPEAQLVERVLRGGLVVVPSGPGLAVDLRRSEDYRRAVTGADVAVTDSGAMVLLWRLLRGQRVQRISGLRLLEALLREPALREPGALFWVHPTTAQQRVNEAWLRRQGFPVSAGDSYVAPLYPSAGLADPALLEALRARRPRVAVLCIGGGVQERLGLWLREAHRAEGLPCPALLCTGAAIGFLSGNQVNIPPWADRLFLGWLFRCFYEPAKFLPRYRDALPLAYLIARYGTRLPPLSRGA